MASFNMFLFSARIPFVSVRPWTPNLGTLTFAMRRNPFYANQALPFNIYGGSTTFGAYDTIGNDFAKVRLMLESRHLFALRSCDDDDL